MTLITESYRTLNRELHAQRADYGTSGGKWADTVRHLMTRVQSRDILDYGCGKQTLQAALGIPIKNYDPALEGLQAAPEPADIVVCGDVLEHIEPDCLDAVLRDLRRVTKRVLLVIIATRPAAKNLPDGRNAHLMVRPFRWWLPTLMEYFDISTIQVLNDGEFMAVLKPLEKSNGAG